MKLLFAFTLLIMSLGCSTVPEQRQFSKIANGMPKYEVLDRLGEPTRVRRSQGRDRWTYIYQHKGIQVEREIHFVEGKVVYVGNPPAAKVSAEQADEENRRTTEDNEQSRVLKKAEKRNLYENLEKDMKGNPSKKKVPDYNEL